MIRERPATTSDLRVTASGPFALVHACALCRFAASVPKGRPGVGKAYGVTAGNKARAAVVAHVKSAHADAIGLPFFPARDELERGPACGGARLAADRLTRETGRRHVYHWTGKGYAVAPSDLHPRPAGAATKGVDHV